MSPPTPASLRFLAILFAVATLAALAMACTDGGGSGDRISPPTETPAETTAGTPSPAPTTKPDVTTFAVVDYEFDTTATARDGWKVIRVILRIENVSASLDGFPGRPSAGRYAAFLNTPEGFSYVGYPEEGGLAIPVGLSVNLPLNFEIPAGLPDPSLAASQLEIYSVDFTLPNEQLQGISTSDLVTILQKPLYKGVSVAVLDLLQQDLPPARVSDPLNLGDAYALTGQAEFVMTELTSQGGSASLSFTFTNLSGADMQLDRILWNLSLVDATGFVFHPETGLNDVCGDSYDVAPFQTLACLAIFPIPAAGLSGAHIVGEFFDPDHVAVWRSD